VVVLRLSAEGAQPRATRAQAESMARAAEAECGVIKPEELLAIQAQYVTMYSNLCTMGQYFVSTAILPSLSINAACWGLRTLIETSNGANRCSPQLTWNESKGFPWPKVRT
jgi:hypothetical protein